MEEGIVDLFTFGIGVLVFIASLAVTTLGLIVFGIIWLCYFGIKCFYGKYIKEAIDKWKNLLPFC